MFSTVSSSAKAGGSATIISATDPVNVYKLFSIEVHMLNNWELAA